MLISEIEKKLDMRLIIKARQDNELFNSTVDLGLKLPAYVYGENGMAWISTYFPKSINGKSTLMLLNKFNAESRDDSYVVNSRINNVKNLAIIGKIMDLPSFVVNRADIYKGFLNIYFRFHSSQIDVLSDLLAQYTSDSVNTRVEWLGPSPGLMSIMETVNSEYPVSVVTFEIKLHKNEKDDISIAEELGIIGEIKNSQNKIGLMKFVVYSDHDISRPINGLEPISTIDRLYEVSISNPFLSAMRDSANAAHIMRLRYFLHPVEKGIRATVFIPSASMFEYYSILYDIARKTDHDLTVRYLLPYSSDVWNFL